ncbi:MAG TPA: amidohydrolase family protein [Longimicrobiales bacterium]|nr:amidohydrolase family protein [Longimicrobiales bacterium]
MSTGTTNVMMTWSRRTTGAALALLAMALPACAQRAPAQAGFSPQLEAGAVDVPRGSILIQNLDTVWTATGEILTGTDILIRDGVVREIGANLSAPGGVEVLDATGLTAIPGFVDEHSHIAMTTYNECTEPIIPETRVIDQLQPEDFGIFRALTGGVTTAQVLHGSCNPIGGQSAIIKPRWGLTNPRQFLVQGAPQTVKFALGENVTRKNWGGGDAPRRYPYSRQGVEALYIQAFTAAEAYRDEWERYRQDPGSFRVPPRTDRRLEALVGILEGDIRVHAHSYRADEILMLIGIADRFGFQIDAFTHALEAYKVADEIREHGAGASTFSDWWHYKLEAFDAIPYNVAILHDQGVLASLNSDSEELQTFALYEIMKPVKYGGVSREDALRMYTLYPAMQLRIDDRVGSIEVGKDGDIALLSGDPFDTSTRVEKTVMDGIVYWDREREEAFRRYPMRGQPAVRTSTVATVSWATSRSLTDDESASSTRAEDDVATGPSASQNGDAASAGDVAPTFALVGGTVHTAVGDPIENGVVLVRDGRIEAVGAAGRVTVPGDAQRIDISGRHVFPGMTDLSTEMGLQEVGQVATASDQREVGTFNPHLRAMIGLQPHSVTYNVARANGITTAITHQTGGVIPGAGSLIQLRGDTPRGLSIQDRAAMIINFPRPSGDAWEDPALEGDDLEELVALFRRATSFVERPTTLDEPDRPFEAQTHGGDRLMLDALAPVLTGEMPAFFRVDGEREIRTLLLFLDEFPGVNAVIVGGTDAHRAVDALAGRDIPVVLTTGLGVTGDRDEPHHSAWSNAATLHAAGVPVAFASGSIADVRNLPYQAARHWAYGLPREVALQGVTLTPAQILGVADEMGSIEPGKRADLVVTDGDILQITTNVQRVWVGGEEVDPRDNKHWELYQDFQDR